MIFRRCSTRERTFAERKGNQHRLKFPREDSLESSESEEDSFSPHCDEEREKGGERERRDRNQAAPKGRRRRRRRRRCGAKSNFTLRDPLALAVLLLYCLSSSPRGKTREILSIYSNLLPSAAHRRDPYCFLPTDAWLANGRDISATYPSYLSRLR